MDGCVDLYKDSITTTHLQLIKYISSITGKKETIRIYDALAPNWKKVGRTLGFEDYTLQAIKNPGSGKLPRDCITDVMCRWKENAPNMTHCDRYPGNWKGLCNLLVDAEQSGLAVKLEAALKADISSIRENFIEREWFIMSVSGV